jgi:hypothetical protein
VPPRDRAVLHTRLRAAIVARRPDLLARCGDAVEPGTDGDHGAGAKEDESSSSAKRARRAGGFSWSALRAADHPLCGGTTATATTALPKSDPATGSDPLFASVGESPPPPALSGGKSGGFTFAFNVH